VAEVAICSQVNIKHIDTPWAECTIVGCYACWIIT